MHMNKHFAFASLSLSLAFFASGCSPVYKTFYSYEPMKTESQRTCAVSCQALKQSCGMNQQSQYQLCQSNAQLEYQNCKSNERWGYDKKGNWECRDNCYCYQSSCNEPDPDACEADYAKCYSGCGGKVNQSTQCVENCPSPAPGSPPPPSRE